MGLREDVRALALAFLQCFEVGDGREPEGIEVVAAFEEGHDAPAGDALHHLGQLREVFRLEELAAECDAWGIPPHLDDCPGFGDVITIEWIGVEEPYARRGLATWLMRKQFAYHRAAGKTRVMLWTGPDNHPAQRLYERLHLSVCAETHVYEKTFP